MCAHAHFSYNTHVYGGQRTSFSIFLPVGLEMELDTLAGLILFFGDKVSWNPVWTGTHCVVKDDLELLILLPPPPRFWNYRCPPPWPGPHTILMKKPLVRGRGQVNSSGNEWAVLKPAQVQTPCDCPQIPTIQSLRNSSQVRT